MKTVGYIRVSTEDQAVSLKVQTEAIQRYCQYKEIQVSHIFVDEAVSGGTPIRDRDQGKRIFHDPEIKNVVIYKIDRAFRNVIDALMTTDYFNEHGVILHVVELGGINLNTGTAIGRQVFTMIASFAEFERQLIKERTRESLRQRKNSGVKYSGNVPFGKKAVSSGIKDKSGREIMSLVDDDHEVAVMQKIQQMVLSGSSYRSIIDAVPNPRGGRLSLSMINKLKTKWKS